MNLINRKMIIVYGSLLILLVTFAGKAAAQCSSWTINTRADSSTCAANGRITITLGGANAGTLDSIHYSLQPITAGGNTITQSTASVLENIKAGDYKVIVEALCSGQPVSREALVTVPGNYESPAVSSSQKRYSDYHANNGQMLVTMQKGKLPYRIALSSVPAGYTGPTYFVTSNNSYTIGALAPGNYNVTIMDACGTSPGVETVQITEYQNCSPYVNFDIFQVANTCDRVGLHTRVYNLGSSTATYSYILSGLPQTLYKPISSESYDTIIMPPGKTLAGLNGSMIQCTMQTSACPDQPSYYRYFTTPQFVFNILKGCNDFDVSYYWRGAFICMPAIATFKNRTTGQVIKDTVSAHQGISRRIRNLPYGSYKIDVIDASNISLFHQDSLGVAPLKDNPFTIQTNTSYEELTGRSGVTGFRLDCSDGSFQDSTIIQLISPDSSFSATLPAGGGNHYYFAEKTTGTDRHFYKGFYVFKITTRCKTYQLSINVGDYDVFNYNWNYTTKNTCNGLVVVPKSTTTYQGAIVTGSYVVISSPGSFDTNRRFEPDSFVFKIPGKYRVAMAAWYNYPNDYTTNVREINYQPNPLRVNDFLGYVCPGKPDNTGRILIHAADGRSGTNHYLYKLAQDGYGETGPYLDSNYTGDFSGNASYALMKSRNYQVKIMDNCQASVVQRVTVLDFTTFQVISTDKALFCINDDVYLKAFNLPTTAVTYSWTGPNGWTGSSQQVVIPAIKSAQAGTYNVTINSDMCANPITGSVNIGLAPYVQYCYSAVTDTSVNPYAYGMLGNWRAARTYTYYGARAQSNTQTGTNIRTDGAFNDFMTFWQKQTGGWKRDPNYDSSAWVWNAESTIFNKKGFELENKDPLGRYNAGLYGYDNAIPVAVIRNSRYREAAFDGFEDYGFITGKCDNNTCPVDRRFDFSSYKAQMDTTQHHTGRYSLRVDPQQSVQLKVNVVSSEPPLVAPAFNMGTTACTPYQILQSVKATSGVLLPSFSPLAGTKMMFSIWVKEEQPCNCNTYTNNKITLFVGGPSRVTVDAQPTGSIIDGWQRYEQVVTLPPDATGLSVVMNATGTTKVYFDDIRFHPYNANMKSFVYDPQSLRLMAELDENNYATFYEYDDDGTLTRVKKETERGVKTIKETKSGLLKETAQ